MLQQYNSIGDSSAILLTIVPIIVDAGHDIDQEDDSEGQEMI